MDLGIAGRRAVVGGGSSGLGRAIAERLAAEGCDLLLWSRSEGSLEEVAGRIRASAGVAVHTVAADATDRRSAERVTAAALETLGGVDILVLNAGGPPTVDAAGTDAAGWDRALQLLATTPIELATRLLPAMRERRWGRIVAVMSWGVRQPIPELAYSNGGRSALMAWLKTVAHEVAADGVTINGALPGRFRTPRTEALLRSAIERTGRPIEDLEAEQVSTIPARRYGRPEEFASYVAYLCSELAAFQTGTFTQIDGGLVQGLP